MASERSSLPVLGGVRTRYRTDHQFRKRVRQVIAAGTLLIVLAWLLLPFFWTLQTSLKRRVVAQSYPPVFWGFDIAWSNYSRVLLAEELLPKIVNGVIVASVSTALSLTLGTPHAYAISKYNNRFINGSFFTVIAARIIPPVAMAVPFFMMANELNLLDTKVAVVLALSFLFEPFVVWIMRGFFDGLPRSLIDSARVGGCTKFQAFYKVMLPLAKPGLTSAGIITWLLGWNHFVLVFILSATDKSQTVPVGILTLQRDQFTPWSLMSAGAILGMIPSILIVIAFQKHLIRGLSERGPD